PRCWCTGLTTETCTGFCLMAGLIPQPLVGTLDSVDFQSERQYRASLGTQAIAGSKDSITAGNRWAAPMAGDPVGGRKARGMRRRRRRPARMASFFRLVLLCLVAMSATLVIPSTQAVRAAAGSPPHVLIVVLENHSYENVIGNSQMPYINGLAATSGYVSTTALSHPSLPDYLALTSGSIYDNPPDTTPQSKTYPGPQFTDELANAGIGWKAYMEDMPVACDLTDTFGPNNYDVN